MEEVEEARAEENLEQEGEEDMDENERTENHNPEGVGNDSGEDIEQWRIDEDVSKSEGAGWNREIGTGAD